MAISTKLKKLLKMRKYACWSLEGHNFEQGDRFQKLSVEVIQDLYSYS